MSAINKGKTRDVGTKFWEICDKADVAITKFNHNKFPHILSGTEVYFQDLDIDPRLCENVQLGTDVDDEIGAATKGAGVEIDAKLILHNYIMMALLHALDKQGTARTSYLRKLREKMDAIQRDAILKSTRVTRTILLANGVD